MTDENTQHISDYLNILRRRKKQILVTASLVLLVSVILAFTITPVYRSTATILIEQQEVPRDLVQTTVTGYANQRLQLIQKLVFIDENILEIADRYQLYQKNKNSKIAELEVIAEIRKGIKVEALSANVTDPRSGASTMATISFNLSYDADKPDIAQKIANDLTSLLLDANVMMRTQQAERTSGFFSDEERKLSQQLSDLEAKLAAYKERNTGRLPELMNLNMSLMERAQKEQEDLMHQIYNLEERKLQLQGQLSQVELYTSQSPGGRLRAIQTQYLSASAIYAPDHPDVVRLKREIEMLKRETGAIDEQETADREYKRVRSELTMAREKYGESHPDVLRLSTSLATLEEKLKTATASTQTGFVLKPDNPAYISLQTQLESVNLSLKAAHEQLARAKLKQAEYEGRMVQTPRVEQEGVALQREYDSTLKKYREIKASLMGAEIAVEMEKEQRGERFSLLVAPLLPEGPESPNRRAFILLGIVLGLGSGVGYASFAEYMDRTIRGVTSVKLVLHAPPLAVIPHILVAGPVVESRRLINET